MSQDPAEQEQAQEQAQEKLRLRPGDVALSPEQLLRLSLFQGLPERAQARLRGPLSQGAVVLRRFQPGEIICRQGDPGWTAFYLLPPDDLRAIGHDDALANGDAAQQIAVEVRPAEAPAAPPAPGLRGALAQLLGRRRPADPPAPVVAQLGAGEVFGEMSCMHRAPRSATLRALGPCHAIEFLAGVLELLLTSDPFRALMDQVYRARALAPLLRATPLFSQAPEPVIELVRQRAALQTIEPGEVLFAPGDPAHSLYVIREGTVTLTDPAGRLLGLRARGEIIGGPPDGAPRDATCAAYRHPSAARGDPAQLALRVALVRIDQALYAALCAHDPTLPEALRRLAAPPPPGDAAVTRSARFGALAAAQGRRLLLVDLQRCTFCGECVSACAQGHADGLPRLSLEGPRIGPYLVPRSCRDCADPPCLIGCPVSAIHRGAIGQIVIASWCIGCGLCAARCPYGAIERHDGRAVTCDQCAGLRSAPRCVHACPHDAAQRVDGGPFFARLKGL